MWLEWIVEFWLRDTNHEKNANGKKEDKDRSTNGILLLRQMYLQKLVELK